MIFQADMKGKSVPEEGTAKHREAEVRREVGFLGVSVSGEIVSGRRGSGAGLLP